MTQANLSRYARQTIFPGIGQEGQRKLLAARVLVVGCGANGTVIANHLARAGVGHLTIVDRDFIELNNLQRQLLFDEQDLAENLPKAAAAERKLRAINSDITVRGLVTDVNAENIETLIAGMTLVMDGTDNFETRYILNDACVKHGIPWIYTGAVSSYGMSQTIIPGKTACLRCLYNDIPPAGSTATCDTAGVIGPVVSALASVSAAEAIKLIVGQGDVNQGIIHMDLWYNSFEQFGHGGPREDCPACGQRNFEFLNQERGAETVSLCGRNAVQIRVPGSGTLPLEQLAARLGAVATVTAANNYLLRFLVDEFDITLFADARAIIKGTQDESVARGLYAKYVGS
ncbi:MAG: thiazole biosynthesis adenylyltransferase ThiF [Chloroflexi bacterium]|nr:MAG: thiazole biosynthesis adenylyltransferase ThiF [Chloroflexota bacterium]